MLPYLGTNDGDRAECRRRREAEQVWVRKSMAQLCHSRRGAGVNFS